MCSETIPNGCELEPGLRRRFELALTGRREALAALPPAEAPIVGAIDAALAELARGEFGRCRRCAGTVEPERLARDFTETVCLAHYSEEEARELERDLELAARVQNDLLPARAPQVPGWEIAALSRPARILTGDYVDFFPLANGRQAVAVGDVMGKGVSASLLGANLQAALRLLGQQHDDVAEIVGRVHELFRYHMNVISFVTLFLAEIDPEAGVLRWCNAGHEAPLRLEAASGRLTALEPSGPAIGLVPDADYERRTTAFARGDLALVYTDGLVEARARDGELFGQPRLRESLRRHRGGAEELVRHLHRAVDAFADSERHDDLTIVALER